MSRRARCPHLLFVNKLVLETVVPRHLACAQGRAARSSQVAPRPDTQREMPSHATCQPERSPIAVVYVGKICSRLGVRQRSTLIGESARILTGKGALSGQ